jgi:hypothetical protein
VIFFKLVDVSDVIFEGEFGGIWVPFDRVVSMDCSESEDVSLDLG